MEKIRNLSLRKTLILYTAASLICTFFLSAIMIELADRTQQKIWEKYIDYDEYSEAVNQSLDHYKVSIPRPAQSKMDKMDWHISEICDFTQTYIVLLMAVLGSCVAVTLFYKIKLQKPILELQNASEMIAANDLDFHMNYENKDEMGTLCQQFEKMRSQLEENNRALWKMIDDERALRAAIAHDIRSPLTTLRGYQEMLLEFIPEDILDKEKVLDMLREGIKQIHRMDSFTENMQKLTSLEERKPVCKKINIYELQQQLKMEISVLAKDSGKDCTIEVSGEENTIEVDKEIVLEVAENLFSNALRYASHNVHIMLSINKETLKVCVTDDGTGFGECEEKVTEAFYHSNPNDDLKHFGLGIYICKVYCEKHGGKLRILNRIQGGASVEATFHSISI